MQNLDSALYSAFGQSEVSIIYTQLNQYYVVLEVAPKYWATPDGLKDIYLGTSNNGHVPLSAVAKIRTGTIPLAINPHWAFSFDHGVVQPRARCVAERRDQSHCRHADPARGRRPRCGDFSPERCWLTNSRFPRSLISSSRR